jgi:hypothetical protein
VQKYEFSGVNKKPCDKDSSVIRSASQEKPLNT